MPADERRHTSTEVEHRFQANLEAPGEARRFVAGVLDEVGATDKLEEAEFLVSELATNAVVHAGTAFTVGVCVDQRLVRIMVSDRSQTVPSVRSASPEEGGGRGLALVDSIADDWGIRKTPVGKVIWVELARRG